MPLISSGPRGRLGRAVRQSVATVTLLALLVLPTHAGYFDVESPSSANDRGSILDTVI